MPFMAAAYALPEPPHEETDQRIFLHGRTWSEFEILLAVRGDRAGVRMFYLDGEIELMSPSGSHEGVKKTLARLVEAYADERGLEFNGFGSWTLKNAPKERGAEPDECYVIGATHKEKPDLAIEVIWTSGGLDKLAIYAGLGVRELWVWKRPGTILVYSLRGEAYETVSRSELLPEIDLVALAGCIAMPSQSQAVRAYRESLRKK
jgi:Uma2 family endonuclease